MEYRRLGRSGVKVSALCLGTMMFGEQTDEATSARIVDHARDGGVNFIDTADNYNGGASEEVTGRAIKAHRHHWVLATKLANPKGPGVNQRGLSRKWLMEECDNSLRRLGTDFIDILYLHKEDLDTPLEETVRALGDLARQGKILNFGLSNFRSWRVAEVCRLCDALGVERPVASQPLYNALNRMVEVEHLPACQHYGLGVVPYSPLARGVLTGKYDPDAPPAEGTRAARKDKRMMETEFRRDSLVLAQEIKRHAESKGVTAGQFALAWVLNNAAVCSVIAGPRTIEQWEEYFPALDYKMTADDEALIDRLVVTGHPSTPGYNDPQYPIEGRKLRS